MARKKTTTRGAGNRKPAKKPAKSVPPLSAVRHQDPPVHTQQPAVSERGAQDQSPTEELEQLRALERELSEQISDLGRSAGEAEEKLRAVRRNISIVEKSLPPSEPGWHFWPEGEALPEHYVKMRRDPQPCRNPECRRRYTPDGGQAVVCLQSGGATASFRCMVCRHTFTLPVKVLKP